jgi:hypothetical protein
VFWDEVGGKAHHYLGEEGKAMIEALGPRFNQSKQLVPLNFPKNLLVSKERYPISSSGWETSPNINLNNIFTDLSINIYTHAQ